MRSTREKMIYILRTFSNEPGNELWINRFANSLLLCTFLYQKSKRKQVTAWRTSSFMQAKRIYYKMKMNSKEKEQEFNIWITLFDQSVGLASPNRGMGINYNTFQRERKSQSVKIAFYWISQALFSGLKANRTPNEACLYSVSLFPLHLLLCYCLRVPQ